MEPAVYYESGGAADGIFDGYGCGWYFTMDGREFGPYDTANDAGDQWRVQLDIERGLPRLTCGGIGVNYTVAQDGRIRWGG